MNKLWRTLATTAAGLGLAVALTAAPSFAQTDTVDSPMLPATQQTATSYPNVANLVPFSESCNFMSRAGYLRFMVFDQQGTWLSRAEAVTVVDQQIATGP